VDWSHNLRDWVFEILSKNKSFEHLGEKASFILVGRIAKELQTIQENKGPEFFKAYQSEIGPILERVNWIYTKHPQFVWKRWNGIKSQVLKTLQGRDALVKVPQVVVNAQVDMIQTAVKNFVDFHQINMPKKIEKSWIKNPKGGWMRNPRAVNAI
jgi:hypothetical protein